MSQLKYFDLKQSVHKVTGDGCLLGLPCSHPLLIHAQDLGSHRMGKRRCRVVAPRTSVVLALICVNEEFD